MNTSLIKIVVFCFLIFLVSAMVLAYLFYSQKNTGEALMSFGENVDAWDRLNRASATLNEGDDSDVTPKDKLHALVLRSESDTVSFLVHVDELGKKAGVAVGASELKVEKTSASNFDEIAATFTLRGGDANVMAMIKLLEELPYQSRIENVNLTRKEGVSEAVVRVLVSVLE